MADKIVVRCPTCFQKYRVPQRSVGQKALCKKCQTRFRILSGLRIADDANLTWINEDDPSSASVMGATGIFGTMGGNAAVAVAQKVAEASSATATVPTCDVKLLRVDTEGAHFEFPASVLLGDRLRNSFPRKCVGCGSREDLHVHLICWRDRMSASDDSTWQSHQDAAVAKLTGFERAFEPALLRQLPMVPGMPPPFQLPFPIFACPNCRPSREVRGRVVTEEEREVCRLSISSLPLAVDFFRDNGGRNDPEYQRLIEHRDQRPDAWRGLDPRIRQALSQWFTPREDERFVGFFRDAEFPVQETGGAGVVLTDKRLVFHKYAACRDYLLEAEGRVEITPRGSEPLVSIFDKSNRAAMLNLELASAAELVEQLHNLNCKWAVVNR